MKPLYIFQHLDIEGPGYLTHVLNNYAIPYKLVRIDKDEKVPLSLDNIGGLVFMGGPMSVNDDLPWIAKEIELIKRATAAGLPILGHCLGAQLISKALGGKITSNPVKEIGWFDIERSRNPEAQNSLRSLPDRFKVFHWHGETFSIPKGATSILKSAQCQNQAFVKDNIFALQFHVEMTEELIRQWCERNQDELTTHAPSSESVQSSDEILDNIDTKISQLHKIADILYRRWLGLSYNEKQVLL